MIADRSEALAEYLSELCGSAVARIADGLPTASLTEISDLAVALCDDRGSVLWSSSRARLGMLGGAARLLLASSPPPPGQLVVFNDPHSGGSRVQDFYAVGTIPESSRMAVRGPSTVVASISVPDIGGEVFGSYHPDAQEVWAEGARITPIVLRRDGGWVRDVLVCTLLNSRTPALFEIQLTALADAVEQTLAEVAAGRNGRPASLAPEALLERAAAVAARAFRAFPAEAQAAAEVPSGQGEASVLVRLAVRRSEGSLVLDLSESGDAGPGYRNATRSVAEAATLSWLLCCFPELPPTDGIRAGLEIVTRAGTAVAAPFPGATAGGPAGVAAAIDRALTEILDPAPFERDLAASPVGPDGRLRRDLAERLEQDERARTPAAIGDRRVSR